MALNGKLTKKPVENLGAGRHGEGNELYHVGDPYGERTEGDKTPFGAVSSPRGGLH